MSQPYFTGGRPDPDHVRARNALVGRRALGARMGSVQIARPRLAGVLGRVFNQGQTGSCTGASLAGCIDAALRARWTWSGAPELGFVPSQRGLYAGERMLENAALGRQQDPLLDGGAYPSMGIEVVRTIGVEPMGPLAADGRFSDVTPENVNDKLSLGEIETSMTTLLLGAHPITSSKSSLVTDLQTALAPGNDAPIALSVPGGASAWQEAAAGTVLDASDFADDDELDHCVYLFDWEPLGSDFIWTIRNSWGDDWGDQGNVKVTTRFLAQHTGDRYALDVRLA